MALTPDKPLKRHPMVGWYDPGQLLRTGIEVAISGIFGRHADARVLESLAYVGGPKYHDLSACSEDFWFDFVSDTGDGFNSTYAVARAIAADATLACAETQAPQLLVFGGDQVYPAPTREAYQERLEDVYRVALAPLLEKPQVFAIPGNHDWYDSLVGFRRLFCTKRSFAGCKTGQTRSYFALKLPRQTWLLGLDIQLSSDIDGPQLSYFDQACAELKAGERVILLVPEPFWIFRTLYPDDAGYSESNLNELKRRVEQSGARVVAFLAGDLHHYTRFVATDGETQLITAGGGGAFLHPTHGMRAPLITTEDATPSRYVETEDGTLKAECAYPSPGKSWWLTFGNLLFPFKNPKFAFAMAFFYVCLSFAYADSDLSRIEGFVDKLGVIFLGPIDPLGVLATVFVFALFILITDTHRLFYRVLGGVSHAALHTVAALWLLAASEQVLQGVRETFALYGWFVYAHWSHLFWHVVFVGGAGALIGSLLVGLYLLISLNVFGRHSNEAFSSLKIADYKNFLRFQIDQQGQITLYAFGIDKVPRHYSNDPLPQPADARASGVHLIERVRLG